MMKIKGIDTEVGDIVYIRAEGYRYGERARVIQIGSTPDSTHFFEGLDPGAVRRSPFGEMRSRPSRIATGKRLGVGLRPSPEHHGVPACGGPRSAGLRSKGDSEGR